MTEEIERGVRVYHLISRPDEGRFTGFFTDKENRVLYVVKEKGGPSTVENISGMYGDLRLVDITKLLETIGGDIEFGPLGPRGLELFTPEIIRQGRKVITAVHPSYDRESAPLTIRGEITGVKVISGDEYKGFLERYEEECRPNKERKKEIRAGSEEILTRLRESIERVEAITNRRLLEVGEPVSLEERLVDLFR